MNVYSIFQRTQARNIPSSLSLLFKGLSELHSNRQPARLIDPVVNLPVTGLFVNRSIHHVLNRTKPSLHPPLSRRNPIKCCEPYAPRFFSSTSFFMFFSFFPNPLIPLAQTRIFLFVFSPVASVRPPEIMSRAVETRVPPPRNPGLAPSDACGRICVY